VRLWDAELAACRDTLHHNKAVYAVAAAPGGAGLVAFGGAEKALRVGDLLCCAVLCIALGCVLHCALPACFD
jgi:hypothetical protein